MNQAAADRAAWLRQQIERANHAYYVLDAPDIPDAEYDQYFRELQSLEREHPELQSPDSPTQRVGAAVAGALAKHTHRRPMLSLANAFSPDELVEWEDRNARLVPEVRDAGYTAEIKIDGAAVSLTYEDGRLTVGATRGNGVIGENITANLRAIADVPLTLKGRGWPRLMEIRGEVYMPYAGFKRVNEERERQGEPLLANPRNAAAGGLRQLDPALTRRRRLRFFAFSVEAIEGQLKARTHWEILDLLDGWGFPVEPSRQRFANLEEVQAQISTFEALIPKLSFQADGVVVKVDRLSIHGELGVVGGREPRWAIARKFAPEVAITRVRDILINVGRTGALNPWASLEPVEISGVTVSNATLHNEDLIAQKDIRVGDWVEVIRAGEVIPQVVRSLPERRELDESGKSRQTEFRMPDACPSCGTPVERPAGEAMRYCPNASCPGRVLEGIVHFASRGAMDIRGLGYERVRQLLDTGLIHDVADLYTITVDQLVELERFASQSATQLVAAIAASKEQPLSVLLFGLGIRHVGQSVAVLLARRFGTMDTLASASEETINDVSGIGPAIAEAVSAFFREPKNRDLIGRLKQAGLNFAEPTASSADGALAGKTYVLTGTLPTLSRTDATALIEGAGGRVAGGVSKKTDAVVAGDEAGGKLEKAKTLGVEVIDEAELLRRLGRRVLHQLRTTLERDAGLQAASYLQEAGFAGGEELYDEFRDWLLSTRGVEHPPDLDMTFLSETLSQFFTEQGWGELAASPFGDSVIALDSSDWAEAAAESRGEFPSCHLTCGLLADFMGRLSEQVVAVMEVECRSRGDARCRFLAGAPETLGTLYDRMAQGTAYTEALGVSSTP